MQNVLWFELLKQVTFYKETNNLNTGGKMQNISLLHLLEKKIFPLPFVIIKLLIKYVLFPDLYSRQQAGSPDFQGDKWDENTLDTLQNKVQ